MDLLGEREQKLLNELMTFMMVKKRPELALVVEFGYRKLDTRMSP